MSRHALPDDVYEWREVGVSQDTFDRWCELLGDHLTYGGALTSHASCDCRSVDMHITMTGLSLCPGPIATVLVERHRWDDQMRRHIAASAPWLTSAQVAAIIAWQPGQPLPSSHGQHT